MNKRSQRTSTTLFFRNFLSSFGIKSWWSRPRYWCMNQANQGLTHKVTFYLTWSRRDTNWVTVWLIGCVHKFQVPVILPMDLFWQTVGNEIRIPFHLGWRASEFCSWAKDSVIPSRFSWRHHFYARSVHSIFVSSSASVSRKESRNEVTYRHVRKSFHFLAQRNFDSIYRTCFCAAQKNVKFNFLNGASFSL